MFHFALFGGLGVLGVGAFAYKKSLQNLEGEDLSQYGGERPADFDVDPEDSGLKSLNQYLVDNFIKPAKSSKTRLEKLADKREMFEQGGLDRSDPDVEYRPDTIKVDGHSITGSWTLVKDYDLNKRLLYLHGGGGTVGSDISHRPLTTNLAKRTKAAVFTPNYRLMPENPRRASIEDCRAAYRWIIGNGPDGQAKASSLAIAGDSAGGNLSLTTVNWLRSTDLALPNAVVVFSPSVDGTASSPSFKRNLETDLMLQPMIAPLIKLPRLVLLSTLKKMTNYSPTDVDISPIHDSLSDLPPTLIQVSTAEVLHDDAVRYANKLRQAGSPVELQSWSHVPHVFQIFDNYTTTATDALDKAASFLNVHLK